MVRKPQDRLRYKANPRHQSSEESPYPTGITVPTSIHGGTIRATAAAARHSNGTRMRQWPDKPRPVWRCPAMVKVMGTVVTAMAKPVNTRYEVLSSSVPAEVRADHVRNEKLVLAIRVHGHDAVGL